MRMILQGAGPRVEHGEDARGAADPLPIVRDGLHGGGGFAKQRGVDEPLMPARHGAKLRRQREGEEVMRAWEQAALHAHEPALGAIVLAFRTVPIATRVITVVERPAVVAPIERAAESRRAAPDDVLERSALGRH